MTERSMEGPGEGKAHPSLYLTMSGIPLLTKVTTGAKPAGAFHKKGVSDEKASQGF